MTDPAVASATPSTASALPLPTDSDSPPSGAPTFADLGLSAALVRAVHDEGYTTPTPIQARAIPVLLSGRDLLGQAQTGTGKTAAFALPLLQAIDPSVAAVQALVLCPTRELALQVATAVHDYGKHMQTLSVLPIYGGDSMTRQLRRLSHGVQVVVGTPGRVLDHLERGSLSLDAVRFVVLDEADEMLRMGFIEDVETILGKTPKDRQTALLSATLPPQIRRIAHNQLQNPEHVAIAAATRTVDTIQQRFVLVEERHKTDALLRILEVEAPEAALIFTRTRIGADELAEVLTSEGIPAEALHSDLSQAQRTTVLEKMRAQKLRVVVATDVAARGLDIDHISHVINFDLPMDLETYVHRIGRTGRAGRRGEALLFVTPRERGRLRLLERFTQSPLTPLPIPTRQMVIAKREERIAEELLPQLQHPVPDRFRALCQKLVEQSGHDAEAIAALLLSQKCADKNPSHRRVPDDLQVALRPDRPLRDDRPAGRFSRSDDRPRFATRPDRPPRDEQPPRFFDRPARPPRDEQPPRFFDRPPRDEQPTRSFDRPARPPRDEQPPRFFDRPARPPRDEQPPRFSDRPRHEPSDEQAEPLFDRAPRSRSARSPRPDEVTKLLIAVGYEHGLRPQDVVGAIANEAGIPGRAIGAIEIFPTSTVVELPMQLGTRVLTSLRRTYMRGQAAKPRMLSQLDEAPPSRKRPSRTKH